ncbi:MAG TPA: hypothetical protein VGB94_03415 [Acidobacteriaceae bacterium]
MGGQFETIGPLAFPAKDGDADEKVIVQWFKSMVEEECKGLSSAVGIYIIARQVGSHPPIPWYVGETEKGFLSRFKQHSRMKRGFGDLTKIPKGGRLLVFFLPLMSGKRSGFRKAPKKVATILAINALEDMLIRSCLNVNENLLNVSQKTLHREMRVPGYINDAASKQSVAATELSRMLKQE